MYVTAMLGTYLYTCNVSNKKLCKNAFTFLITIVLSALPYSMLSPADAQKRARLTGSHFFCPHGLGPTHTCARAVCVHAALCAWSADGNSCSVINRFKHVMPVCEEMPRYAQGSRIDGIWMSNWCCGCVGESMEFLMILYADGRCWVLEICRIFASKLPKDSFSFKIECPCSSTVL